VTDSQIDTKGLIYPRALQQLLTGVYLAEICLIGLFGIAGAIGPLVMMIVFLIFTVLYHVQLNAALDPLLNNLPKTLELEEELHLESLDTGRSHGSEETTEKHPSKDTDTPVPSPTKKPNFLTKFFKPHIYSDYPTLRNLVPHDLYDANQLYEDSVARNAYYPPSVTSETPLLWIPRDGGGISRQEVFHTSQIIPITDEGSTIDDRNKIVWDEEGRPPLWTPKIYY